jgi:hypothetical protein
MIYSPDHNFLMLKNIKVGGTSLEVELSNVLPDNAIVTTINPENMNHIPRNYDGFYNHMPYSEINKKINLLGVMAYTIVRNPYTTVLSDFFYKLHINNYLIKWNLYTEDEKNKRLDEYFNSDMFLKSTKYIYMDNDKIHVEKFIKYELGIEDQVNSILTNHSIENIKINTFEKKYKPSDFTVQNTFRKADLDKIYNEWSWEFTMFGYDK